MKCGLVGTWADIKSQPCKSRPAQEQLSPTPVQNGSRSDPSNLLGSELEKALDAEDHKSAMEIVDLMELQAQTEKLEDEELALSLMEEELRMLELTEQLDQLEIHEQAEIQAEVEKQVMDESLKVAVVARPPATPLASSTPTPTVKPPVPQEPSQ